MSLEEMRRELEERYERLKQNQLNSSDNQLLIFESEEELHERGYIA